jgi:hypothetical protein
LQGGALVPAVVHRPVGLEREGILFLVEAVDLDLRDHHHFADRARRDGEQLTELNTGNECRTHVENRAKRVATRTASLHVVSP